ncbi:MAG TPA: dihydrofolate reductase family protein [Oligoflexus sp.]|uniref:dihydrofolate reductase family protein n=1 Tax=Oligoflexus sp. TaxID=1971216 RepID=UPI002D5CE91F|nr:dihydrofolate reductase family protein [Oligoflexus sp.]HYX34076.1 dihydrofolate reductase family protein [Oligoflexus sp.]
MQIINVMASSIDGRIGLHDREGDAERQSVGLSSQADQKHLRAQIAAADAIIVGATSVRANGECLDHPGRLGTAPAWYIFAQHPLPLSIPFWKQTHIPRFLISPQALPMPAGSGVQNLVFGHHDPAVFLHHHLATRQHEQCLLFGGGIINNWFYRQNLVDELRLTLAPLVIGQSSAPFLVAPELLQKVNFSLLASHSEESFVFLRYKVTQS